MRAVAVVDRIVDGERAVLIVGDPPEREVDISAADLPPGAREGHWLCVEMDGDRVVSASVDEDATARAKDRVRAKMEALRRRRGRGS